MLSGVQALPKCDVFTVFSQEAALRDVYVIQQQTPWEATANLAYRLQLQEWGLFTLHRANHR
jgi:hypothetical protein